VILSSTPIPGNEFNVSKVIDGLMRAGCEVVHSGIADVHATGHARPRSSRPTSRSCSPSGSCRCTASTATMVAHAKLGRPDGRRPDDHVLVCEDGDVLELDDDGLAAPAPVPAGYLYVDGIVGDVGQGVLRDRKVLAEEGVVVVIVTVDVESGR
jgi:ribonuclease J